MVAGTGLTVLSKLGKSFTGKAAESVGKGMKVLGDNSRDFLAASMAMEEVGKAFAVSGPAMGLVAAQFQSDTLETRMGIMSALLDLVQTDGVKTAIDTVTTFFNLTGRLVTTGIEKVGDFFDAMSNTALITAANTLSALIDKILGTNDIDTSDDKYDYGGGRTGNPNRNFEEDFKQGWNDFWADAKKNWEKAFNPDNWNPFTGGRFGNPGSGY